MAPTRKRHGRPRPKSGEGGGRVSPERGLPQLPREVRDWAEPAVDIVINPDGELTIEGTIVTLENGSVEGGCIVGSLRGDGVYIPRIRIPLDMCRMAGGGRPVPGDDEDR